MDNQQHEKFAKKKKIEVGDIIIKPKTRKQRYFVLLVTRIFSDVEVETLELSRCGNLHALDALSWLIDRNSLHLKLSEADG